MQNVASIFHEYHHIVEHNILKTNVEDIYRKLYIITK